jgi:hypothetical protein
MSWHYVHISHGVSSGVASRTLVKMIKEMHRDLGSPESVRVYLHHNEDGQEIFYFCPDASALFRNLLHIFFAQQCEEPAQLDRLVQVL